MITMNIQQNISLMEKLAILSDAAKYDVACTSSGVDRSGNGMGLGNSIAAGICHSFSADAEPSASLGSRRNRSRTDSAKAAYVWLFPE